MDRDEVLALIRDRLADILEIDPDSIKEGDSFVDFRLVGDAHGTPRAHDHVERLRERRAQAKPGHRLFVAAEVPRRRIHVERTDRSTIAARLRRLNCEAMEIRRSGYVGTRSADYEVRHATLNLLLYQWQMAHL